VQALTDADFKNLLAFRTGLRRFLHWSQTQARAAGLTPRQHQLLVAIKGHPHPLGPAVSDLADYLLLRHHSVVELIDRAALAGLVERHADPADGRVSRVRLTPAGEQSLARLAPAHLDELRTLAPILNQLVAHWAAETQSGDLRSASRRPGIRQPRGSKRPVGHPDGAGPSGTGTGRTLPAGQAEQRRQRERPAQVGGERQPGAPTSSA
jgi:DNA-binding MarR family transcriptional regulator